ncbi:hypothetical protein EVAR_103309_1 [Eumeta japonica]|uniref:Uncharacterized protein n=1 Tax=Eumeta variegata TaxID=151549 RepID=A0A4C1XTB5_EUMVA|nr:hypothetical protein EVAR_103309_1 [Eumeta japonica]
MLITSAAVNRKRGTFNISLNFAFGVRKQLSRDASVYSCGYADGPWRINRKHSHRRNNSSNIKPDALRDPGANPAGPLIFYLDQSNRAIANGITEQERGLSGAGDAVAEYLMSAGAAHRSLFAILSAIADETP